MIKNIVVLLLISISYVNATYIYGSINGSHINDDVVLEGDSYKERMEANMINAYILSYLNIINHEFKRYKDPACELGKDAFFSYNMNGMYDDKDITGSMSFHLNTSRCNEDIKQIKWFLHTTDNNLEADASYDTGFLYIDMNVNIT